MREKRPQRLARLNEACANYKRSTDEYWAMYEIATAFVDCEAHGDFSPEYRSPTAYVKAEIIGKYGIAEGNIFNWIGIIKTISHLTPQTIRDLNIRKLEVLKQIIKKVPMTPGEEKRLLEEAKTLTIDDLYDRYPQVEGEGKREVKIRVGRKTQARWKTWIKGKNAEHALVWLMDNYDVPPTSRVGRNRDD